MGQVAGVEGGARSQGQVTAAFWLGLGSQRRGLLEGLPTGYRQTPDVIEIDLPNRAPPALLEFTGLPPPLLPPPALFDLKWCPFAVHSDFHLRCHLFLGRALLASDESGLSDPFVRLLFQGRSKTSRVRPHSGSQAGKVRKGAVVKVMAKTLNPAWDETLELGRVRVYGASAAIKAAPPPVVLEIFDQDQIVPIAFADTAASASFVSYL